MFVPDRPARVRGNTKGRPAFVWLSDENGGCPQNYARMVSVESEIMSEDMADYVHAHPLDIVPGSDEDNPEFVIPPGADLGTLRGGPEVTFDGLMPKAGRYRAWTQFRRNDRLYTFVSTFEVVAP